MRYERATDVVYGEITSIEPYSEKIDEFGDLAQGDTKKAVLKILKSWKGQATGTISYYFNYRSRSEWKTSKERKHVDYPHQLHGLRLVFLRTIDGKRISETAFGNIPISSEAWLNKNPETQILNFIASGKSMRDALVAAGNFREVKYYDESSGGESKK